MLFRERVKHTHVNSGSKSMKFNNGFSEDYYYRSKIVK
jgi:hypothetical protein